MSVMLSIPNKITMLIQMHENPERMLNIPAAVGIQVRGVVFSLITVSFSISVLPLEFLFGK